MKTLLALATATLLSTTSLVAAQETTAVNAFGLERVQASDGVIELGTVTAEMDGVIEIYNATDTEMETLLGSQEVTAGTNTNVRVILENQPTADIVAVLKVGGAVVATADIPLDRFDDDQTASGGNEGAGGDSPGDNESDESGGN